MTDLVLAPHRFTAEPSRFISEREMEALAYLCFEGSASPEAIGRDLAYPGERASISSRQRRGHRILSRLSRSGLLSHRRGAYALTERGRIAAALVLAKHPGLREAFCDA